MLFMIQVAKEKQAATSERDAMRDFLAEHNPELLQKFDASRQQ